MSPRILASKLYPHLHAGTRQFVETSRRMLINNEWVNAAGAETLEVTDPASGAVFTTVPSASTRDVDAAVEAARRAFEGTWAKCKPVQRERLMWELADLVEAHADELAHLESLDNGKPANVARHVDVPLVVDLLRYMAGWSTKIEGATIDVSVPYMPTQLFSASTRREPVGVVGAIIPWNFPLLMIALKVGPALACGCTVVLKPAEETPLSALRFGELAIEAGYPAGVLNIVTGYGHTAGAALAKHPGVNKIAFTGSTEVGKLVGKACLDNMTRFTLELGGKSPVIVLEDADPKLAAAGAAQAIFFNHGQVCTAGSRLFVHERIYDEVVESVGQIADRIKLGPGLDPNSEMGPLVSDTQLQRVQDYLRAGGQEGLRVVAGGVPVEGKGFFVKPTVLAGMNNKMRLAQEEIFGPVLVAMSYRDIDEVAATANDTIYGLSASIWSNNLSRVNQLIPKIKAGTIWVNCHNVYDPALPFGGFKQSGIGRDMGRLALDHYTETKAVLMAI